MGASDPRRSERLAPGRQLCARPPAGLLTTPVRTGELPVEAPTSTLRQYRARRRPSTIEGMEMPEKLQLDMSAQPDDSSCGPTCLHAVYGFFGDALPLDQVLAEVPVLDAGGTLASLLAGHALRRGYRATIYTYNLQLFDPTWFDQPDVDLAERLQRQAEVKRDSKLRETTRAYLEFLALGGTIRFAELTPSLIRSYLQSGRPILTGLSATYLYDSSREVVTDGDTESDDLRGEPVGHFVVLSGYDPHAGQVTVSDPLHDNPKFGAHEYDVPIERVLGAILLGVLTHDANLLILDPPVGAL